MGSTRLPALAEAHPQPQQSTQQSINHLDQVSPQDGVAKISINRPRVRNAFRPITVSELKVAMAAAQDDTDVVGAYVCVYERVRVRAPFVVA